MSVATEGLRQLLEVQREEQPGGSGESDEEIVSEIEEQLMEVQRRQQKGSGNDSVGTKWEGGDGNEMDLEEERKRLLWKKAAVKYRRTQKIILDGWIDNLSTRGKRKQQLVG